MAMANNKHVMDLIPVVTSFLVGMAGGAVLIWSTGLAKTINTKERKRRTCAIEEDVVNAFVPHDGEENGDDDDEEVFLIFVVFFFFIFTCDYTRDDSERCVSGGHPHVAITLS